MSNSSKHESLISDRDLVVNIKSMNKGSESSNCCLANSHIDA